MTPDGFQAELCASLTSFYEDMLKVPGAGGRPQAKIIKCRFARSSAAKPPPAEPPSVEDSPATVAGVGYGEQTPALAVGGVGEADAAEAAPLA